MQVLNQKRLMRLETLAREIDEKYARSLADRPDLGGLIDHFSRVTNISYSHLVKDFLPDFLAVEKCLGEQLCHSNWHGFAARPALENHNELSLYVALRTIETLNAEGDWTTWSGRPENIPSAEFESLSPSELVQVELDWQKAWLKAAFRCAITVPIGYFISHTAIRGANGTAPGWDPSQEDIDDYIARFGDVTIEYSPKLRHPPKNISQATHLRLFGRAPASVTHLGLAEMGFYDDVRSPYNPISNAFHDALKHVFYDRIYFRLPYWWILLLNHHFMHDDDYQTILHQIPSDTPGARYFRPEPRLASRNKSSSDDKKDGGADDKTHEADANDPESRALSSMSDRIVEAVRDALSNGDYRINTGGALFQGVGGRVYVVVPLFFHRLSTDLNRPGWTPERVHEALVTDQILDVASTDAAESEFAIVKPHTKHRLGKVRALPLSEKGVELLFPDGFSAGDNPDLKRLSTGRT